MMLITMACRQQRGHRLGWSHGSRRCLIRKSIWQPWTNNPRKRSPELAQLMDEGELSAQALAQAGLIRNRLNDYRQARRVLCVQQVYERQLRFSATIFPSVAWWTGRLTLRMLMPCFRVGLHEFASDWAFAVSGIRKFFV